jgi:hypothetical protein
MCSSDFVGAGSGYKGSGKVFPVNDIIGTFCFIKGAGVAYPNDKIAGPSEVVRIIHDCSGKTDASIRVVVLDIPEAFERIAGKFKAISIDGCPVSGKDSIGR